MAATSATTVCTIKNKLGLHARPASLFVQTASKFDSDIVVSKDSETANGKSLISREERGFVKILAAEESGVILGAQMMCARATDMIGELATAVANGLTAKQLLRGMRAHPTYNEGVGEALEELEGGAVHVVPRRKR